MPDDLIVAYRDVRQHRQKNTGQIVYSNGPQNVHFHLRAACIRARYPSFPGASALIVTSDVTARFRLEHIRSLDGVLNNFTLFVDTFAYSTPFALKIFWYHVLHEDGTIGLG